MVYESYLAQKMFILFKYLAIEKKKYANFLQNICKVFSGWGKIVEHEQNCGILYNISFFLVRIACFVGFN